MGASERGGGSFLDGGFGKRWRAIPGVFEEGRKEDMDQGNEEGRKRGWMKRRTDGRDARKEAKPGDGELKG
jgi:hypothetical protein